MSARDRLRRILRSLHLESHPITLRLRRFYPRPSESDQLVHMLAANAIDTVLDVGANVGQFATSLRVAGFCGKIISFEPLADAHLRLTARASHDRRWHVAERVALGDRESSVTLNVSGNSVSSSVLPMLDAHLLAAPDSAYVSQQLVRMRRLDSILGNFVSDSDRIFLKIDVQGFEEQVLEGASALMPRVRGLLLELSLVSCYEGQTLFEPFIAKLREQGFVVWGFVPGTFDPETHRLLQVDTIFFRDMRSR